MSPKNKVSTNYQKYVTRFNLANEINTNLVRISLPISVSLITVATISPVITEIEACEFATEQDIWFNSVIDEEFAL